MLKLRLIRKGQYVVPTLGPTHVPSPPLLWPPIFLAYFTENDFYFLSSLLCPLLFSFLFCSQTEVLLHQEHLSFVSKWLLWEDCVLKNVSRILCKCWKGVTSEAEIFICAILSFTDILVLVCTAYMLYVGDLTIVTLSQRKKLWITPQWRLWRWFRDRKNHRASELEGTSNRTTDWVSPIENGWG